MRTLFIEPGSPWENGYVESFNGKLRVEHLNVELFDTLLEAQVLTERWRCEYNQLSPHSSLGYRPPAPEATAEPLTPGRLAPVPALTQGVVQTVGAGHWRAARSSLDSELGARLHAPPAPTAMEPIPLADADRERATDLIREYFARERDEELGQLAAGLLLDFIAERLGPYFYNRGIDDAQALIARFADSLDADLESPKRFPE